MSRRKSNKGYVGNGTNGTMGYSPGATAGMESAKARQEARWSRKSGKVKVRVMTPEELAEHRRQVAERRRSR